MKKLFTKGFYVLPAIIFFLCAALSAKAQYSGTNLETGGLYTALAKDGSNNLYVTRVTSGTGGALYEVDKYTGGTGTPVSIYSGLTHETGDYPWGLAVTSTGNVFISTDFTAGGGSIIKLTYSGGVYTSSIIQTGRYFSALAVDTHDNLYTAEYDAGNSSYAVVEYTASSSYATGTKLYDNLKTGAGYTYPTGLAVASNGNVYVADAFSNDPSITDGGHVYKLTAASAYAVSTLSSGNYVTALNFSASGNLFSSENRGAGYSLVEYAGGTGSGVPISTPLHTNGIYYPWGIAFISIGKIFVADGDDGVNGGAVIKMVPNPPTVTTTAVTSSTSTGTTLNGIVNDNGNTTTVNFIYGTSSTLTGATTTPATTGGTISAGSGNTNAALNISGLTASTKYYYAVSATNSGGTRQGAILNFFTTPSLSYTSPIVYNSGTNIPILSPVSSVVPLPAYGNPVTVGSGFLTPFGVAADVSGNVYVADYGNHSLKEIPAGGGAPITLATGYTTLLGVAVDAANNVYTCDAGTATVQKIPNGGTGTPVTIGSGFSAPYGLTVDAAGNVYVADYSNNAVYKIAAAGGATTSIGSGFASPTGVAVDAAGNVYVADYGNNVVKEIPVGGGAPVTIGSGFSAPVGVGVDPSGNIFVADYGNSTLQEIPTGGGTQVALGAGYVNPTGVAIDGFGKLFVAGYLSGLINQLTPVGGYYISTALPLGLGLSNKTGKISGIANAISPAKNYTVTAYNTGGGTSAVVNIKVVANARLSNLTISQGTLTPVFAIATTSYTATVPNDVSSITLTPTTNDAMATVTVNGTAVTSGTASANIPLNFGTNAITTVVTARDGTTTKTYTVTITRVALTNADLANLAVSAGTLTPAFTTATTSYTASVPNSVTSVTVTPTTADATATVTVNGIPVNSGIASGAIPLSVGPNTITTVSTAQDGVTT
ncbi:cadherin-like beta sandwich domain-containing protein, partial [Mucilaginibacter gotjawali]